MSGRSDPCYTLVERLLAEHDGLALDDPDDRATLAAALTRTFGPLMEIGRALRDLDGDDALYVYTLDLDDPDDCPLDEACALLKEFGWPGVPS